MTAKEQQTIQKLEEILTNISSENRDFKNQVTELVSKINEKVELKHEPFELEKKIIESSTSTIQKVIEESLIKNLTDYNSPMKKYVNMLILEYEPILLDKMRIFMNEIFNSVEFNKELKKAMIHKVTKLLVSNIDSFVEDTFKKVKNDEIFKSKIIVKINELLENELRR